MVEFLGQEKQQQEPEMQTVATPPTQAVLASPALVDFLMSKLTPVIVEKVEAGIIPFGDMPLILNRHRKKMELLSMEEMSMNLLLDMSPSSFYRA